MDNYKVYNRQTNYKSFIDCDIKNFHDRKLEDKTIIIQFGEIKDGIKRISRYIALTLDGGICQFYEFSDIKYQTKDINQITSSYSLDNNGYVYKVFYDGCVEKLEELNNIIEIYEQYEYLYVLDNKYNLYITRYDKIIQQFSII